MCAIVAASLSACGGGGGGSDNANTPVTPVTPTPITINAADAFKKIVSTPQTISDMTSETVGAGTATLIIRDEEAQPFVTNGASQATTSAKVFQFQRLGTDGKLRFQNIWKLHLDAQMRPVGLAGGPQFAKYNECQTVTAKNDLPTSTNSSGIFFSGTQTTNYSETFRAGTYAHYCDPTQNINSNVEWAVVEDASIQYFCLTMPVSFYAPKVRMCMPVDKVGAVSNLAWIKVFNIDNNTTIDYRKK